MGGAAKAIGALSAGSALLSGYSDIEAGKAKKLAIKRQIVQEKMKRNSDQIVSDEKMEQLNATQIAKSSTSGFDYGGSFANLTASNIEKFSADSHIKDLSSEVAVDDLNVQKASIMKMSWINAFTGAASLAIGGIVGIEESGGFKGL